MDETAEIRARLGRIGALAQAGAGRAELLSEVRGLLEEGERTLQSEAPGLGAGPVSPDHAGRETVSAREPPPTSSGEEVVVT